MKFTTLPILLALIVGLAPTIGFHVAYKANQRGNGIAKIAPWLRSSAAPAIDAAASWFERVTAFVTRRHALVSAAVLLAMVLVSPEDTAALAVVGVAGTVVNIDALERDLLKKSGEAASLLERTMLTCQAFEEKDKDGKVISTGRPMTADETKAIQALIEEGNGLKARIEKAKGDSNLSAAISSLTAGMTSPKPSAGVIAPSLSLGGQYVSSKDFEFARSRAKAGATGWASPGVELMATTLDESSGSGGPLLVTEYRPGIVQTLFKRLTVADLLAPGTTDSTSITYMKETTFTNAAAAVAEGAQKPESTLAFEQVSDLVKKIAHWLPVTDEMLEDVAQIRSYIDARLMLGLDLTEEDQLLNGSGVGANLTGLMNRSNLTATETRAGSVTNAEAIFIEHMKIFNASFVMPTATVLNPANWQTIQLSKDGNGQYYGSGPFAGSQSPTLWGLPAVVTPSIVANTALAGAFNSAAQVFRKGGVRIEASNSHQDFFVRNLTAIRAEKRLALAVYRAGAFGKIDGLN
jgi:HK97 family phage major capsid protein